MTHIDQSDLYRRNSAVFKNFVLYSPDPPSAFTEGLGTRLVDMVMTTFLLHPIQHDCTHCGHLYHIMMLHMLENQHSLYAL